jgi:hypothetical protein
MVQPCVQVDHLLGRLVQRQVVCEAYNLIVGDPLGFQLLNARHKVRLFDLLHEALVVAHDIDLTLLNLLFLRVLVSFLGFWLIIFVLLCEDDAEIDAFVNESCLDTLQS